MNESIKIDKTYKSEKVVNQPQFSYDKNNKKRPSWVKVSLDKKIIFMKILFNNEAFWYRKYFEDYFFPLEATSEDYKNYYNEIAEDYEQYIPQNKEIAKKLKDFFEELGIEKDSVMLDLGAGTGIVTEEVAKDGYKNLTLLDISDKELEIAKTKDSLKGLNFMERDLIKEDIGGNYDVIFETMSLDYFRGEKMPLVLKKVRDSLKDKGKFIVVDRHIYPEFWDFFKEIESGKFELETPEGKFDYYYFIGKNS